MKTYYVYYREKGNINAPVFETSCDAESAKAAYYAVREELKEQGYIVVYVRRA